ncbi:hypothetical protein D1007_00628 [Hordeum vulgare]|nr:hypothetical protein D1007_00628 [Hordeum vulgare]
MHIRWKTMRVSSEQRWLAYKDTVAESLDKALELFAIKTNVSNLQLDLNQVASPIVEASPPRINEEANIEPLSAQQSCIQHEPLLEANDEHDDDENDSTVLHDNSLGDLDKYNLQETMDHSIPYSRGYASESDDEGPSEEVDEEGFTAKEVEAFTKACGSKELADDLQDCCQAFSDKRFARLYNALLANKKLDAGGLEFLNRHIQLRPKWARAYDEDGRRYGQMTSNIEECFNRVLKGVCALPVTAIVQYTFDKLRAYFLKYSQETDDQIAGENKKRYKYQFPPKVDKWMVFDSQTATLYNNEDWTYQVNEPGGTTNDGQQHGNRAFKVSLSLCDCSCGRPRLLHLACLHLYTATRTRNVDVNHPLTVREYEFSIMTMKHTWAPRFEPYFDQSQWPEYHGVQLWPDPEWKVVKWGRRKTKRFRGDMDGWGHGGGREMENNQFQEPTERSHC